jgi:hypothetical protein
MSRALKSIATASLLNSYTGSIVKLVALGADDGEASIQRIEFGAMTYPESHFTASSIISGSMQIPAGSTIDGPIGRFKNLAGSFLIYFDA